MGDKDDIHWPAPSAFSRLDAGAGVETAAFQPFHRPRSLATYKRALLGFRVNNARTTPQLVRAICRAKDENG
jgi:hypothetical protein